MEKDPRLLAHQDRLVQSCRAAAARRFGTRGFAKLAFHILSQIEPNAAADFLVHEFILERLQTADQIILVDKLFELPSRTSNSGHAALSLKEIARRGGPAGKHAADLLFGRQWLKRSQVRELTVSWQVPEPPKPLPEGTIEALYHSIGRPDNPSVEDLKFWAEEWRNKGDTATLDRIYYQIICRLEEGAPIQPLLDYLGQPTTSDIGSVDYWTDEGHCMCLEVSADGKLMGMKHPT